MPTTYSDQFYLMDPYAPPPAGTALTVNFLDYVDADDNGVLTPAGADSINGQDITGVYNGDTVTVNIGGTDTIITGVTFYTAGGGRYFTPTDGTNLSNATFVESTWVNSPNSVGIPSLGPPCFTAGTMIRTDRGEQAVEDLAVGDMVETLDHGFQRLRWVGCSQTDASGEHAPVVFKPGAIDNENELRVSPQHRVLVQGWMAELYFGRDEVLVPAKHLVNGTSVRQEPVDNVGYYHLLFDRHEIIWSNGVLSESFFPGDQILLTDRAVRAELLALFPELERADRSVFRETARETLKMREAKVFRLAS